MTSKRIVPRVRTLAPMVVLLAAACQATTQADVATPPVPATAADAHREHTPAPPRETTASTPGITAMPAMDAETRFMHHMIAHHAQALAMVSLVPPRTSSQGLRLLAERIELSQKDEIALMRRWLERRGKPVPPTDHHAMHAAMPGMITEAEMARLAAATGTEFERLFLELMTRHHQGALAMVAQLLGSQGAAQDSELFRLAADIDADQQAEIARMQSMLRALPSRAPR